MEQTRPTVEAKLRAIAKRHGITYDPEMTFAAFARVVAARLDGRGVQRPKLASRLATGW